MKLQFLFCFYLHNFHLRVRCPCESLDAAKCLNGFLKVQDDGPTVLKKKKKDLYFEMVHLSSFLKYCISVGNTSFFPVSL